MILAALLLAADAPGAWVPVGVTPSRLRVFVERASLTVAGQVRTVRVRMGSPTAIAGPIVVAYQNDVVDCAAKTWRMTAYDARAADGGIVKQGRTPDSPMLTAVEGTIGAKIVATACAM